MAKGSSRLGSATVLAWAICCVLANAQASSPPAPPAPPARADQQADPVVGNWRGTLKNAQGVEASKLFLNGMIAHHEGAISMAQAEIGNGQFQPAIDLAKTIGTTQQQEIETMRSILATL